MDSISGTQTLKGGKVRKSHMEKFTIDPPPVTAEGEVLQAYKELVHPHSPQEQIGAVEKMVSSALLSEESARVCTQLLLSSLLKLKSKVPLRKKILKESSAVEASSALHQIQHLVKSSTWYMQQHYSTSASHNDVAVDIGRLLAEVLDVVRYPTCPLDLRVNCGQLVAVLHRILAMGELRGLVKQVMDGIGQYADLPSVAQLAIVNGILCITPGPRLYVMQSDAVLGVEVLQAALTLGCLSSDGGVAVSAIRVTQQWTLRTLEALQCSSEGISVEMKSVLDFSSPLITNFLEYLWLAWDHFLDSVKHATRETFINLIKIQRIIDEVKSKSNFLSICKMFLKQLSSQKFKCSAVGCMVPAVGSQSLLELYPTLPQDLLGYMKEPVMASRAAELLEALFTQHQREVASAEWQSVWLTAFIDLFSEDMQTFGYELLFKKLLFTCPDSLDTAVARLVQCSENPVSEKLCLLIMCVKIGRYSSQWLKKCKKKHERDDATVWKCLLPYHIIKFCFSHRDKSVQSAIFSLLCESPKSTELPEKHELDLIYDYYVYSVTSQSPPYRQHILKSTKKLFQRIRDGIVALVRSSKNNNEKILLMNAIIIEQASFCRKLFSLMVKNLSCGASFPRRGTSLSVLEQFHEVVIVGCGDILGITELIHDEVYIDTLISILGDSFENNKIVALKLLQSPSRVLGAEHQGKLSCLLFSVFSLASSCRPPDSMTAAYVLKYLSCQPIAIKHICAIMSQVEAPGSLYSREIICKYILYGLTEEIKVAREQLLKAAASGPMYGLLLCLKMLLSDVPNQELEEHHKLWVELIQEVLTVCFTISELVAPVVRNSSPEGHLPMDLNPESLESLRGALQVSLGNQQPQDNVSLTQNSGPDELVKAQAVSAQMLLLCAWRCVKEISLILGDLIQEMPLSPSDYAMLSVQNVRSIGQYFLTQLFETKHRGAFEQSYVGFGRVCDRLWQCEDEQHRKLPEEWLTEVMTSIQDDCDTRLCATRRSAGVPFIVQAILSAEPSVRGALCLGNTMKTLLALAKETQFDGSDARIHTFNMLRSVYRDTRLGDLVIPYVSEGVKAAIRGYKSTLWAERNAATLLFASLVTRMLGVKQEQDDLNRKNAMSALVFFRRYPELFDFLKDELQAGAAGIREGRLEPALFPTLLLLARLAPAPLEGRTSSVSLTTFTPSILQCASSSVLQLRDLASHALVPLVPPCHFQSIVNQLCGRASLTRQNDLHGSLLCLLKLFNNYLENGVSCDANEVVSNILNISWTATKANSCLVTRSCAIKLFTFLCSKHLIPKASHELTVITADAFSLLQENDPALYNKPWSTLCQKHAAEFLLENPIIDKFGIQSLSHCLITNSCYEVRQCALKKIDKLPDLKILIFKMLLSRMNAREENMECLTLVYQKLYQFILQQEVCCDVTEKTLTSVLEVTLSQASEETCLELRNAVIQLGSAAIYLLLFRNQSGHYQEQFSAWLAVLVRWSGSEHSDGTRLAVAQGVARTLPFLHSHPSVSDGACLGLLETVVYELQDDWSVVRGTAAEGVTAWLTQIYDNLHPCLHPTRLLPRVCDFIGSMGTTESLTLLVTLALKEDLSKGFGLSQNDDRVFDKGEMNVYSENLLVARTAAASLSVVLLAWPSTLELPSFFRQSLLPYLYSPATPQSGGSKGVDSVGNKNDYILSGTQLLSLLEQDICHIFQQISALTTRAVFSIRNLDLWLVRLGCRSAMWRSLWRRWGYKSSNVASVVAALHESVIKVNFIQEIIIELSDTS